MQQSLTYPRIIPASENSLIIYFAARPSKAVTVHISAVQQQLQAMLKDTLFDLIPSFNSLLVIYDALRTDHFKVFNVIEQAWFIAKEASQNQAVGKTVTLPVYYAPESGPELEIIAQNADISVEEVIRLHSEQQYQVYSIGFAPGFAYLGEVDPVIATPRLKTPRKKVPKGAVAIADLQTAVYPSQSPGGWNIIGLCPETLFDLNNSPAMPIDVGDTVVFESVPKSEFLRLGGQL